MIEGIPVSLFEVSGWGAFGFALLVLFVLNSRGKIKTEGEVNRIIEGWENRVADLKATHTHEMAELKESYQGRLADKDEQILNKRKDIEELRRANDDLEDADRIKDETIRTIVDHLGATTAQGQTIINLLTALDSRTRGGADSGVPGT